MGSLSLPFPKYAPPVDDPENGGPSASNTDRTLLSGLDPNLLPARTDPSDTEIARQPTPIEAGASYLALLRRQYGDWPKAVAAYHFGSTRFGDWVAGKTPDFEATLQRKANEGLWRLEESRNAAERQKFAERDAKLRVDLDQFQEMTRHLPYVFLGDPDRCD
jgi:hypothetical protein